MRGFQLLCAAVFVAFAVTLSLDLFQRKLAHPGRESIIFASMWAPGEPMQLWGFDALLYVLADRPSASRLGFSYAVAAEPDPTRRADRERELVADIERVRPRVLVVQETDDNQLMPGGSRAALRRLPALASAIARCYGQTYRNRDYTMYTRTNTCGSTE